jgi:1-aminocyclopropane-1-carboxylate deaminase/D-cysteine desulfhydrase-like pyridoxal-dependent ACC family enzyme
MIDGKILYDLTPVEKVGDIWFKRDDLFKPFLNSDVNGGKLRQALYIILKESQGKNIKGVITGCSILSPQAPIIGVICEKLNLRCVVFYGGKYENILKSKYPQISIKHGAEIKLAPSGRNSVLYHEIKKFNKISGGAYYVLRYGMNYTENPEYYDLTANQVRNIPENIKNLVVSCGSAITALGILKGIKEQNKKIKVLLVGIAPNRLPKILHTSQKLGFMLPDFEYIDAFNKYKGFRYENKIKLSYGNISLHPTYEAKAFKYLLNKVNYKKEETLFWIVGGEINA